MVQKIYKWQIRWTSARRRLRRFWWIWWPLLIFSGLFEDRIMGSFNKYLDDNGSTFIQQILQFVNDVLQVPIGITGFLIAVFIIFVFGSAYWETRSSKKKRHDDSLGHVDSERTESLGVEFYDDREIMTDRRGGLKKELEGSKELWMSSIAGAHVMHQQEQRLNSLKRVILVNPYSQYMKSLISIHGPNGETFPQMVRDVSRYCQNKNIDIKWSDNPIINVVIGNPNDADAWARVQTFIPYQLGQYCPSYVVTKKEHPDLYNIIKISYERMWAAAHPPSEQLGLTIDDSRKN